MSRQTKFRSRIRFSTQHVEGGSDTDLEARVAAVLQDRPDTDLLRQNIANTQKQGVDSETNDDNANPAAVVDDLERQIAVIKSDIEYRYWELASVQAEKLKLLHNRKQPAALLPEDTTDVQTDLAESPSIQRRSFSNRLRQLFGQPPLDSDNEERSILASDSLGHLESATRSNRTAALEALRDSKEQTSDAKMDTSSSSEQEAHGASLTEMNDELSQKQIIVRQCAEDPVAEAEWLASLGRYDDAIARLDRAKELSPARTAFIDALREVYILSREFDLTEQLSEASVPEELWKSDLDNGDVSNAAPTISHSHDAGLVHGQERDASDHVVEQMLYDVEATPFELVQAYIELDDQQAARTLLNKILQQGSANEQKTAREILNNLSALS